LEEAFVVAFDRQSLKERLEKLSPLKRALFAVSCAERLFPLYKAFSEKAVQAAPERLQTTLDHLWEAARRKETPNEEPFLEEYESLIPGEDAEWMPLNTLAENAVAALAYAFQSTEAENAAWAAVQGYEAVDYIAHSLGAIDFKESEAEAAILKTECVQTEIQRQLRDVAELERSGSDEKGIEHVVENFRNRAVSEGLTLVPIASGLWK
jgi:uncharacterized protein YjaG (DUF416 family)